MPNTRAGGEGLSSRISMICWGGEARARVVTLAGAFAGPPHGLLEDDGRGLRAGPDVQYEGSIDVELAEGKCLQTGLGGADGPVGILGHRLWRHAKVFALADEIPRQREARPRRKCRGRDDHSVKSVLFSFGVMQVERGLRSGVVMMFGLLVVAVREVSVMAGLSCSPSS